MGGGTARCVSTAGHSEALAHSTHFAPAAREEGVVWFRLVTDVALPYELHDLLLAVEVVSPGNPLLDYQIKRDLYLREGVREYWVINPGARNVSRWCGRDDPGEVLSKAVSWQPEGMSAPLVIELAAFFEAAGT